MKMFSKIRFEISFYKITWQKIREEQIPKDDIFSLWNSADNEERGEEHEEDRVGVLEGN